MPFVVWNADGSIHTVADKEDDVLVAGQTRKQVDVADLPDEHISRYTYDGTTFTKKTQAVLDAEVQALADDRDALTLIEDKKTDLAITEALKDATLSQGVKDALNARKS